MESSEVWGIANYLFFYYKIITTMKTAVFNKVRDLKTNLVSTTRDKDKSIVRNHEGYENIININNKTIKEKGIVGEQFVIEVFKPYFEDIAKNKHINQGDLISNKYKVIIEVKNYTNNSSVQPEVYLKFVRDCIETPKYFHIFLDLSNTNDIETFFVYDFKLLFVNIDDLTDEYMNKLKNTIMINNLFTSYIETSIDINRYNNIFMLSNSVVDHLSEINTNKVEEAITNTFDKVLYDHCAKTRELLNDITTKMSKSYQELYKVSSYFGDVDKLKQRIYNNMFGTNYYEDVIPIDFIDNYDPSLNTYQQLDKFVNDNIDKLKNITWTRHKFETYIYKRKISDKDFRSIMDKYKKQQSRKDSCYHGDSKQLLNISVDEYDPATHNDAVYTYQLNDSLVQKDNVNNVKRCNNIKQTYITEPIDESLSKEIDILLADDDEVVNESKDTPDIVNVIDKQNKYTSNIDTVINEDTKDVSDNEKQQPSNIIKLQTSRLTKVNDVKYTAKICEYKQQEIKELYTAVVYKSDLEHIGKCLHKLENKILKQGITNTEFVNYCNDVSTDVKYKYEREKTKEKEPIDRRIQDLLSLFDVYEKYTKNCFRTLLHKSNYYITQCIKRQNVVEKKDKNDLYNNIIDSLDDYLKLASKYNRSEKFPMLRRLTNCNNVPKAIKAFNKDHNITDMCRMLEEFSSKYSNDSDEYKNVEAILNKYNLRVPGDYNDQTKINNFLEAIKDCMKNEIPFVDKTFAISGNKQCNVYNIVLYVVKHNHMKNQDKLENRGEIYYNNDVINKYIESVRLEAIEKGLDKNNGGKSCYPHMYYK